MFFTLEENFLQNLKKRYQSLHPLILHRSIERSKNLSDLFDILESVPNKFPLIWDEINRRWKYESDIINRNKLKKIEK
jgi:hypothetical protein